MQQGQKIKKYSINIKKLNRCRIKATNDNSKIYKAYLVINTRDNRRKYNNCTVCDGTDFLKKHKGTTELEDLPCILEDYPVTLIGPNKKIYNN